MHGILIILPVVLIVVVSAIIVRVAGVLLKLTGMDEKIARFQALSAFTGTGFTTRDSEHIMQHPRRRRIVMVLMILGNAGIVSVMATFVISFTRAGTSDSIMRILFMILLLLFVFRIISDRRFMAMIDRKIEKRIVDKKIMEPQPFEEIYHFPKGYLIAELNVNEEFEEVGMTLSEAGFRAKDILVLSITRKDGVNFSPKATDKIEVGDTLVCYGPSHSIKKYIPD